VGPGRPSLRLLAVLLAAALPPLIGYSLADAYIPQWEQRLGSGTSLLLVVGTTVVWAFLVAVLAARPMTDEARSMADIAERGIPAEGRDGRPGSEDGLSGTQRRMAATLEDRNRQIFDLVSLVRSAPIALDASTVARAMVGGARQITADPTWVLAVMRVRDARDLAPGVYSPAPAAVEPIGEVHRWASTTERTGGQGAARLAVGPWGAFAISEVAAGDEFAAILLAPWEGRADPSPAELGLFTLLGQNAATAIEHALLYARLRTQTDELNRMAAVQTDFLRGITHDLQTPLTSIRALASELQGFGGLDAAARVDLQTIAQQADRLRRMVGQLLVVSRLEVGALTPRQEVFRVEPLVERTWDALRASGRPFTVEQAGTPHLVFADPDRLEQVLWALLDNAAKYSPAGSAITVRIEARPSANAGGLASEISVSDEGLGMDDATRARAFDQFFRAPEARRMVPDGSGIGLYAARGLVEAMGGSITLESHAGAGTTVRVTLPAEPSAEPVEDLAGG